MKKNIFLLILCTILYSQVFNTVVFATNRHNYSNPSPTPTCTPTSTPYCEEGWDLVEVKDDGWVCTQPTSTPTATPTATPSATPTATPSATPTNPPVEKTPDPASPPVCVGQPITKAPLYDESNMSRVDTDTVRFSWESVDEHAQSFTLYYGMSPDNLNWNASTDGHSSRSLNVHSVPQGTVWVKICTVGACGDEMCGPVIDP